MPAIHAEHLVLELLGIGQVAVVAKNDAEGRIHVERLRLGKVVGRTGGRVADMADAPVTGQRTHVAGAENVADQPRPLVQMKGIAFRRCNTGGILPAVLQYHQPVIEQLVDRRCRHDSENPAHNVFLPS